MPNLIPDVERIKEAKRRGWPEGTSEVYREVDMLLARIQELEAALEPFVRVAFNERATEDPTNNKIVYAYLKDCRTAAATMDPRNGRLPRVAQANADFFSVPAE